MKIKITADSTCDLPEEILKKYDIDILPLCIITEQGAKKDGLEITALDIFQKVAAGHQIPSTAAVNSTEYHRKFQELKQRYDAIIHINLSSEFSSTYANAVAAAKDFSDIYVIDSRNLSTGQGHLVLAAAEMAQAGKAAKEIYEALLKMVPLVESSFVIDTLSYLKKGGRCSSLAAFSASVLQIKPCIEVQDGKMHVGKKYRGSMEKCIFEYVKERLENRVDIDNKRIFITHSNATVSIVQAAKEAVIKYGNFEEIIETVAGCTISCHCGPNTLGVLFFRQPQQ